MVLTRTEFCKLKNVIVINVNIDKLHSGDAGTQISHVDGQHFFFSAVVHLLLRLSGSPVRFTCNQNYKLASNAVNVLLFLIPQEVDVIKLSC